MKSILDYETVSYDKEKNAVVIIDQTKLPNGIELLWLETGQEIYDAICRLKVGGAPAIGAAAAFGLAALAMRIQEENREGFLLALEEKKEFLNSARPTAVNLSWALNRMMEACRRHPDVGCDRVAANGDTANKIGTSLVAIAANYYHVPFYVCAPVSTIGFGTPTGKEIAIEQRNPEEISKMWYQKPMTAKGVKIYNPAFDVTNHSLITGFITEKGVFSSLQGYNFMEPQKKTPTL